MQSIIRFFSGFNMYVYAALFAGAAVIGTWWYVGHLKYEIKAQKVETKNAQTAVIIEKQRSRAKEFEAWQRGIIEEEVQDVAKDINDSVGYHTIIFD